MRALATALAASVFILSSPAGAMENSNTMFSESFEDFNRKSLRDRVRLQILLIATGHINAVPTENFSKRIFDATVKFQSDNDLRPSGYFDDETEARLTTLGNEMLDMWAFRLMKHPVTGHAIWFPTGMGMYPVANKFGLTSEDGEGRIKAAYNFFPRANIVQVYNETREKMARQGDTVHYAATKDDWFVISASTAQGTDKYLRYHQTQGGIIGFVLFWNNEKGIVSGERMAILMSASLGSIMNGRPMLAPPDRSAQQSVARRDSPTSAYNGSAYAPAPAHPPAQVAPGAPVPRVEQKEKDGANSGTGFFVNDKGRLVTNAHVIRGCSTIAVKLPEMGRAVEASVIATDDSNDLALLQVDEGRERPFASLRVGARLGEGVAAFGYPHADILASNGNFTLGNVTALAGISNDIRYYQISAPLQSGNSGGPLFDEKGGVIGVVSNKINAVKMAGVTGDLPQNVNFAIKGTMLLQFLETNGVRARLASSDADKVSPADTADIAGSISAFITCQ